MRLGIGGALGAVLLAFTVATVVQADTIDFEGLDPGTIVSELSSGKGITGDMTGTIGVFAYNPDFGPSTNAAVVFDSSDPSGGDDDLGTPNENFGGPGVGDAGETTNKVALGHILIIAEDLVDKNPADGLVDDPDDADNKGAYIDFDFSTLGKGNGKKDLGAIARSYGDVYVAQVAMGANDAQVTRALLEADAWPGPSLVIAYSTCIAHGIDMSTSMSHQKDAVKSGYWPLYRFRPSDEDGQPFKLDSAAPSIPIKDFRAAEARFAILTRTDPDRAADLADLAQGDADERWRYYEQLAGIVRSVPHVHHHDEDSAAEADLAGEVAESRDGQEDQA